MVGKDDLEAGLCDSYAEQLHDLLNEFGKCHFEPNEERKKQMTEKFHNELIPNSLRLFEKRLTENNGRFSGNQLTYADVSSSAFFLRNNPLNIYCLLFEFQLYLVVVLDFMGDKKDSFLEQYPNVKQLYESVRSHEKLKAYLDARPNSDI